jgi:hypothetical protein
MPGMQNPDGLDDRSGSQFGDPNLLLSDVDLDSDEKAIDYVDNYFAQEARRKNALQRKWFRNIEFLAGNQWLYFDPVEKRWLLARSPKHKVRYVGNLCAVYVLTRIAKLLKHKPVSRVWPATSENEDYEISKTANRVLKYLWQQLDIHEAVLPEHVLNALVLGNSFLRTWFDPTEGPELSFGGEEVENVPDEVLEQVFGKKKAEQLRAGEAEVYVNMGEAQIEAVSPFAIYPDPQARNMRECMSLLDVRRRTLDQIRWDFEKGRDVSAEGSYTPRDFYEGKMNELLGHSDSSQFSGTLSSGLPTAQVKELWVRPNKDYPEGYHLVIANRIVLSRSTMPKWCNGKIPYQHFADMEIPNRFWARATFDDLIPPQKLRNRAISRVEENANLLGSPRILNPLSCQVSSSKFTNQPGEIIPYQYGMRGEKPEYMMAPPLPAHVTSTPEMYLQDAMTISGLNEPTFQSRAPTNVRTSSGLAQLRQEDESRLTVLARRLESNLRTASSMLLRIVAFEYHERRVARIMGDRHQFEVVRFQGKDLLGRNVTEPGANYFDVEITIEPGFRSKQAQDEFLMNAAAQGAVNLADPKERRWLLRKLDLGGPEEDLFADIRAVETQAHYENRIFSEANEEEIVALQADGQVGPHPHDDDEVHIDVHQTFQRSSEYMRLPTERRELLANHVAMHQMRMQAAMQQQQMAAMGGGPMGSPQNGNGQSPAPPGTPGSGRATPPQMRGYSSRPGVPEFGGRRT